MITFLKMSRPDIKDFPGDEKWWKYFDHLFDDSLENSIGCKRVHPKIESWLNTLFKNPPALEAKTVELMSRQFRFLRQYLPKINAENVEDQIKRSKTFIKFGRIIHENLDPSFLKDDPSEIRQATSCLATHLLLMFTEDVALGHILDDRVTNFAQQTVGEQNTAFAMAEIIIGYSFQKSLKSGEFDDL